MAAFDSNPLAAPVLLHRPRPALSLLLALAVGVVAVALVRHATTSVGTVQPEHSSPAAKHGRAGKGTAAPLSLAPSTFRAH